jgi:hypothetical protein
MKIVNNRDEQKTTGIKGWVQSTISGPYRWVILAGLLGVSLLAGFAYTWKFHPRSSQTPIEPTETPTALSPTPVTNIQEQIVPLPVLTLTIENQTTAEKSAVITVNGGNPQNIAIQEANGSSWLISLTEENPNLLLGGKQFKLVPAAADEAVEIWLYAKQMREVGVHISDFVPALVSMNGSKASVYYLIAYNETEKGIIFQLPDAFFSIKSYSITDQEDILEEITESVQHMQNDVNEDDLNELLAYISVMMKHPDEKINGFSVELFGEYFAIHDLWAASYVDLSTTPLYYYNLRRNKIEPVVFDLNEIILPGDEAEKSFPFSEHPLFQFSDMQMAYASALAKHSTLQAFKTMQREEYPGFHSYEKQIIDVVGGDYSTIWDLLSFRHQMMRLQLDPPYPVRGFVYADPLNTCVDVQILNLMVLPVDVDRINLFGVDVPLKYDWLQNPTAAAVLEASDDVLRLNPYENPDTYMDFCIPSAEFEEILSAQEINDSLNEVLMQEDTWMIEAHISGLEKSYAAAMIPDIPPQPGGKRDMPPVQSIKTLTSSFPFITANAAGTEITFHKGSWQVDSDIVIPTGITVNFEAGCELHFAPDVVLLSFSAFQAAGTESEPVVFTAMGETWPGMIVIDAGEQSVLDHVIVEKTCGIKRGGWILTGGITFYRSPVIVRNSTLQDSVVEDAINVIRTTFTFDHLNILRTPSDAFDSDFANGEIIDSHFEDIGGDAVDISGAYVEVKDTTMLNITDKGLSAGEDSHIIAENLALENVGIGGAAKDLSTLEMRDCTILNARVAGLAAYIKKSVYGPSSIKAENVQILNTSTETLVQTGSSVIWNGKEQDTKDLNVKTLYQLGILGN